MQDCEHNDCTFYPDRTICCLAEVVQGRMINCPNYSYKGENMVQTKTLEIVAKLDGKQVPLETVSTETFEAIKALEKPKEIPVARIGHYKGDPNDRRLFLVISEHLREIITKRNDIKMVAIELIQGHINKTWKKVSDVGNLYENVKPL